MNRVLPRHVFQVVGTGRVIEATSLDLEGAIQEAAADEVARLGLAIEGPYHYCRHEDGRLVVFDPEDEGPAWFTLQVVR